MTDLRIYDFVIRYIDTYVWALEFPLYFSLCRLCMNKTAMRESYNVLLTLLSWTNLSENVHLENREGEDSVM
jgi:hypothetical protein